VSKFALVALATAAALTLMILTGCTSGPVWVAEQKSYTATEARGALDRANGSPYAEMSVASAGALRSDALVSLRNRGGASAEAAALITKTFPSDAAAVPVYVELAKVDGRDVLLLVEAWGPRGGSLDMERLWVLDAVTGEVIDTASAQ
jgi:hypothetical protein